MIILFCQIAIVSFIIGAIFAVLEAIKDSLDAREVEKRNKELRFYDGQQGYRSEDR